MNARSPIESLTLSISAVERDTGLSKDTLRVWERRYRFPAPTREPSGERGYTIDEVEKLRLIKRLMEAGNRPGRLAALSLPQLQRLSEQTVEQRRPVAAMSPPGLDEGQQQALLALLQAHRVDALGAELRRLQSRLGVLRFVTEVAAPLNAAVGDAWLRGQLRVFEEHVYSELMQDVLRRAIASMPAPTAADAPCVLLTTLPGETHGQGLLMAQALLTLEGCRCVALGVQTPTWDIVLAAAAFGADVVALGFTASLSPHQVVDGLTELRAKLPAAVQVWAGGSAPVLQRRPVAGVRVLASAADIVAQLPLRRTAPARGMLSPESPAP